MIACSASMQPPRERQEVWDRMHPCHAFTPMQTVAEKPHLAVASWRGVVMPHLVLAESLLDRLCGVLYNSVGHGSAVKDFFRWFAQLCGPTPGPIFSWSFAACMYEAS